MISQPARHNQEATRKGIANYHIGTRHSIENYFLEPDRLLEAIVRKLPQDAANRPTPADVSELLRLAVAAAQQEAETQLVTETQEAYRKYQLHENHREHGAEAGLRFNREACRELAGKLHYYPGATVLGKFVGEAQTRYGTNIRPEDIIATFTPANVPQEIAQLLERSDALQ